MKLPVYLDYAATTPVDEAVAKAMAACLTKEGLFANPASRSHIYGWQAEEQVEIARRHVADLLCCDTREIVWTSGATESNNLALKGVFEGVDYNGHIITSVIEHKAVIDPIKWLEQRGVNVTWLKPDEQGKITVKMVAEAMQPETCLVSLMHVNNETGVINPIPEIGQLCADNNILFHVDAAQSAGKIALDVKSLQVDLLSLSAHKFYGPKGVGALFVKRAVQSQIKAQVHGGGHERGMRSGTLATHQLVGIGEAAKLAAQNLSSEALTITQLRERLWKGIADLPNVRSNSKGTDIAASHLNVCFSGVDGETLLLSMRELAVSNGSACTSASMEPSYVLKAMGLTDEDAHSSVRFSLGRFTTVEDIEQAVSHIRTIYSQLQVAV